MIKRLAWLSMVVVVIVTAVLITAPGCGAMKKSPVKTVAFEIKKVVTDQLEKLPPAQQEAIANHFQNLPQEDKKYFADRLISAITPPPPGAEKMKERRLCPMHLLKMCKERMESFRQKHAKFAQKIKGRLTNLTSGIKSFLPNISMPGTGNLDFRQIGNVLQDNLERFNQLSPEGKRIVMRWEMGKLKDLIPGGGVGQMFKQGPHFKQEQFKGPDKKQHFPTPPKQDEMLMNENPFGETDYPEIMPFDEGYEDEDMLTNPDDIDEDADFQ